MSKPKIEIVNGAIIGVQFEFWNGEAGIVIHPRTPDLVQIAFRLKKPPRRIDSSNDWGIVGDRRVTIQKLQPGEVPGFVVVSAMFLNDEGDDSGANGSENEAG